VRTGERYRGLKGAALASGRGGHLSIVEQLFLSVNWSKLKGTPYRNGKKIRSAGKAGNPTREKIGKVIQMRRKGGDKKDRPSAWVVGQEQ